MPRYTDEGVGCQPCRCLLERPGGAGCAPGLSGRLCYAVNRAGRRDQPVSVECCHPVLVIRRVQAMRQHQVIDQRVDWYTHIDQFKGVLPTPYPVVTPVARSVVP